MSYAQAEWVYPLEVSVFGRSGWTMPPNSQGFITLAAAWLLERYLPDDVSFDASYLHAIVEAYRAIAWERDSLLADPDNLHFPVSDLVAPSRLESRLDAFDPDRAGDWLPPQPQPGGTAFMCTADRFGTGVALIQSNFTGIGSGLSAGSTGVFLHNRGAGFSLLEGHPNEMAPGKRPLHTLAPTLWTQDGRLDLLLGTRGSHQQPQFLLHALAHIYALGAAPAAAQALPRWSMDEFGPGSPSTFNVESRMPAEIVSGLTDRGHQVSVASESWLPGWGPISMITIDEAGVRTAAADPRISTALAAVR